MPPKAEAGKSKSKKYYTKKSYVQLVISELAEKGKRLSLETIFSTGIPETVLADLPTISAMPQEAFYEFISKRRKEIDAARKKYLNGIKPSEGDKEKKVADAVAYLMQADDLTENIPSKISAEKWGGMDRAAKWKHMSNTASYAANPYALNL